jgi:ABC-type antimicrobial peptide transport system permease subunit
LFFAATIALAVAGILAAALVVSAQPAWRAARLRLGENLRVE